MNELKIFIDYLKTQGFVKFKNSNLYTDNPDLITDLINTFGYNVFYDYNIIFNWIIYKVDGEVYKTQVDKQGNVCRYIGREGDWEKNYDDYGNCIYFKSRKIEWEKEFDSNGNCIYYNDCHETWYAKYDDKHNLIKKSFAPF